MQASSRDMEGGEEGDVVTIAPVTSGSGGWMVEVNTETADYEGVLVVSTSFRPESRESSLAEVLRKTRLGVCDSYNYCTGNIM